MINSVRIIKFNHNQKRYYLHLNLVEFLVVIINLLNLDNFQHFLQLKIMPFLSSLQGFYV
jgi:hypothetical protein